MPDSVTVVTRRSWGSRLKGSFKGIIVGFVLVAIALWTLFANEGRAVRRYKALKEGARNVVTVSADRVDPAYEGKLVHLSGMASTRETLRDSDFNVTAQAIHLRREVEMFQWLEDTSSKTEKKVGGSTETTTTYTYRQGWSDRHHDSRSFQQPSWHRNPTSMPYGERTVSAQDVRVGAFRLSPGLIQRMSGWADLSVRTASPSGPGLAGRTRVAAGGLYVGRDPARPEVGDLRVSFQQVPPGVISLVALQSGNSFLPYQSKNGPVQLLRSGTATAAEMFAAARQANKTLTWILRLVGLLTMTLGFRLILRPFSVLADVLPALGNLVERGAGYLALLISIPLSLAVIAFSWIAHRPLLAIGVFFLVGLGVFFLVRKVSAARREAREAQAQQEAKPDLPPLPPLPKPVEGDSG